MIDLKITSDGDFYIDNEGDIALTGYPSEVIAVEDIATCVAQLAYMAVKTEKGDYTIQPTLGNDLYKLLGLPNKPDTAKTGEGLIKEAITSYSVLNPIKIESWPKDLNTMSFEVRITVGNPPRYVTLKLDQILQKISG